MEVCGWAWSRRFGFKVVSDIFCLPHRLGFSHLFANKDGLKVCGLILILPFSLDLPFSRS